jgi:hypothetical protein
MKSDVEQRDAFGEHVLHVGSGFKEKERPHVLETLSTSVRTWWDDGIRGTWMWKSRCRTRRQGAARNFAHEPARPSVASSGR